MKNQKLIWGLMAIGLMASCSDKKDDGGIDEPKGDMEVMTPDESKTYLQNTATEFLDLFKPADQKEVIELAAYFSEEYGDLELPENFDIEEEDEYSPKSYLKALSEAAKGDLDGLTRAAYTYTYRINFDRFTGVYEPNKRSEEWVKTGESNDIIFRFNDKNGQRVELKVVQSGGSSDIEYSYEEEYYYDDNEEYKYYISIPHNVVATLTQAEKELAKTSVVSSVDIDGHKLSADVNAYLCNLAVTAKVEGDDSKVSANTVYSMNGNKVASAQAVVNGHDLCNKAKYDKLGNADDDDEVNNILASMLEKGECVADVLGKVQVYGQVTYYKELVDDLDTDFGYPNSKDIAKIACQTVCDRLNKNVKMQLRYDGTKTDQATVMFQPYFDQWDSFYENSWEYYPEAVLLFPDKTTYSFDSYFEKFTNVSNKFETLLDAYEKMWDNARK